MWKGPAQILQKIEERKQKGLYRSLSDYSNLIDFSSNDYLGFSKLGLIHDKLKDISESIHSGSTGSRLISGNSNYAEQIENKIATFHHAEAALIFNSGYDANIGLLSSIASKHDLILYDELIHASVHDGIRLSLARHYKIRHNDMEHLKRMLERNSDVEGNIFIVVESVYSMDGDSAPLKEIVSLCDNKKIFLIVDEAHAIGVFGVNGRGLCNELNLETEIFARVYTYGKAMGCHGAAVVGGVALREFLINYARSFIYTTALPPHSLKMIEAAYDLLLHSDQSVILNKNIAYFNHLIQNKNGFIASRSAIHSCIIPGNKQVNDKEEQFAAHGFFVKGIKSPTVRAGTERVRICIHAFNTEDELKKLAELF